MDIIFSIRADVYIISNDYHGCVIMNKRKEEIKERKAKDKEWKETVKELDNYA